MATYSINTAEAIETLINSGIAPDHARAFVQVFSDTQESLAAKSDIQLLGSRIDSLASEVHTGMDSLKKEMESNKIEFKTELISLKKEMESNKSELKKEMDSNKSEFKTELISLKKEMESNMSELKTTMENLRNSIDARLEAQDKKSTAEHFKSRAITMGVQFGIATLLVSVLGYLL